MVGGVLGHIGPGSGVGEICGGSIFLSLIPHSMEESDIHPYSD